MTSRPPEGVRLLAEREVGQRTRLVLVRHGEPEAALHGIVAGPRGDTGLSERGRAQVTAIAGRLVGSHELGVVGALYASTLPRAVQTAELLAPAVGGLDVTRRHDLREHDPGELDGLNWAEAMARHALPDFDAHPDTPIAPGGESLTEFHVRARAALLDVAARHEGSTVLVACHGGIVAAAVGLALGLDERRRLALPTHYASMSEFLCGPGTFELARYNDRYPLVAPT